MAPNEGGNNETEYDDQESYRVDISEMKPNEDGGMDDGFEFTKIAGADPRKAYNAVDFRFRLEENVSDLIKKGLNAFVNTFDGDKSEALKALYDMDAGTATEQMPFPMNAQTLQELALREGDVSNVGAMSTAEDSAKSFMIDDNIGQIIANAVEDAMNDVFGKDTIIKFCNDQDLIHGPAFYIDFAAKYLPSLYAFFAGKNASIDRAYEGSESQNRTQAPNSGQVQVAVAELNKGWNIHHNRYDKVLNHVGPDAPSFPMDPEGVLPGVFGPQDKTRVDLSYVPTVDDCKGRVTKNWDSRRGDEAPDLKSSPQLFKALDAVMKELVKEFLRELGENLSYIDTNKIPDSVVKFFNSLNSRGANIPTSANIQPLSMRTDDMQKALPIAMSYALGKLPDIIESELKNFNFTSAGHNSTPIPLSDDDKKRISSALFTAINENLNKYLMSIFQIREELKDSERRIADQFLDSDSNKNEELVCNAHGAVDKLFDALVDSKKDASDDQYLEIPN